MRGRSGWHSPLLWSVVVTVAWVAVGAPLASYQGRLSEVQENDTAAFLPADAEATRVNELGKVFADNDTIPAVIVIEQETPLTGDDLARLESFAGQVGTIPGAGEAAFPPLPAPDGTAAQLVVPVADDNAVAATVSALRDSARQAAPEPAQVYVTGPAAFVTDLSDAFGDIDSLLLVVTAAVVAVILLLVYRSPLLPLIVLVGAGIALGTASAVVYALADAGVIVLNGQSQGIMLILVFGAATNYALLQVARYREELRRHPDRLTAVRVAWRRALGPILASGFTVILALLCLLLSELNSNRSLGPVAALGVASAMLVMLTYLPAALGLAGRAGFWPFRPRYGSEVSEHHGIWQRFARLVQRRDRIVWIATALVLGALATLSTQLRADGVAQSDLFLGEVGYVAGQEALARHFPAGGSAPTVVVAQEPYADEVAAAAAEVDAVAQVRPGDRSDGLVRIEVVLTAPPDSAEAVATVPRLREAVGAVPGAQALVGGPSAVAYDTREAARRDRAVIIPLALLVVFLVIALLLRALLVTALLVGSVVLSFGATMGLSGVAFRHVFDFPGADPSLPLFAFIFLVALGVDYSVFLMTRVREEASAHGTRTGVRAGLRLTGRVITSAGVVLAATFAALGVIPILFLAQIAFIVAVGVLIDTLVVRSLLVPGLCHDIDHRIWWPGRLSRRASPPPTSHTVAIRRRC